MNRTSLLSLPSRPIAPALVFPIHTPAHIPSLALGIVDSIKLDCANYHAGAIRHYQFLGTA
jgi:hypothetical protein